MKDSSNTERSSWNCR